MGAGVIAVAVPLVAAWTVRLFGPLLARGLSVDPGALDRVLAPLVFVVCTPIAVFFCACRAARLTGGSPLLRASVVGLAPAVAVLAAMTRRTILGLPGPPSPYALPVAGGWALLGLLCGMLAGALARRRLRRHAAAQS